MGLTKALFAAGAPHNILVNGLVVGVSESDQLRGVLRGARFEGWVTFPDPCRRALAYPDGPDRRAEEFANAVCFLACDAASYITGCTLNVDGA